MIRQRNRRTPVIARRDLGAGRALALLLLLTGSAAAQPPPSPGSDAAPGDDDALRREVDELRRRQRELERRLDARQEHAPVESSGPHFHFGRDGFVLGTADGKNELRLHAVLHVDGRAYFGDVQPLPDTFLIRRARPFVEGTLFGIFDFRLMPELAPGQSVLLDAYVELRPWRWLRLRAGKFRVPIGLEWLQSDSTMTFVERSLATDLVPYRDIGVMLAGDVALGAISYAIGAFNGAPDGANGPDLDPQSEKDYVGRVFFRPLRPIRSEPFANLGFGISASYGRVKGTPLAPNLPSYRSTGQQTIFTYINNALLPDAAASAAGDRWRFSPQVYWYIGPLGLLGEYVFSSQHVERLGADADIQNRAWNLTASIVLTMERASYEGVVPKRPVDFHHPNFGAFELTFRYSELRIDGQAFPMFADPATSVRGARELAGGLNWHLTENVKFMLSFHRTDFTGGAPMDGDREPENALLGRLQIAL